MACMKECADCGLMNPDDAASCPACGANKWTAVSAGIAAHPSEGSVVCPVCAAPNDPTFRTCSSCRAPLSGGAGFLGTFGVGSVPGAGPRTRRLRWFAIPVWAASAICTGLLIFQLAATLGRPRHFDSPAHAIGPLFVLAISATITIAGIHSRIWRRDDG